MFAIIGSVGYYGAYGVIIVQTVNGQISVGDLTFLSGSDSLLFPGLDERVAGLCAGAVGLVGGWTMVKELD